MVRMWSLCVEAVVICRVFQTHKLKKRAKWNGMSRGKGCETKSAESVLAIPTMVCILALQRMYKSGNYGTIRERIEEPCYSLLL
jgi:hypothetical protein